MKVEDVKGVGKVFVGFNSEILLSLQIFISSSALTQVITSFNAHSEFFLKNIDVSNANSAFSPLLLVITSESLEVFLA